MNDRPNITVDPEVTADGRAILNLHFFSRHLTCMVTLDAAGVAELSSKMTAQLQNACAEAARLSLARRAVNEP